MRQRLQETKNQNQTIEKEYEKKEQGWFSLVFFLLFMNEICHSLRECL